MITTASIATVAGYWFVGAVLYRALAVRLRRLDDFPADIPTTSERDLLLRSVLPALAITGTIGTGLALVGLFRAEVMLALGVLLLLWRRRDAAHAAAATWHLTVDVVRAIRGGSVTTLAALIALALLTYILILF